VSRRSGLVSVLVFVFVRILALACMFAGFCASRLTLQAQDFRLFDRDVEVHGFASQGFVYTNTNNWLTMNSNQGSGAFTDFGFNVSTNVTDRLRIGAQLYDRNLGQLGQYHPSLDWAVVDYRFKSWLGFRGGKVKTTLGLYTDSQDLDFLRTFALLPQSVYPTDLRDATIAHLGGDIYGNVSLVHRLGNLSYTAYAGHRSDSIHGGYVYLARQYGLDYSRYGGLQYGADLRWKTPLKGLLVGVSRMNEDISAQATARNSTGFGPAFYPESDHSKADWTNQFFGTYTVGKLRIDSEYRRFLNNAYYQSLGSVILTNVTDVRGWYVSGTYRATKRLSLGSYYSRYSITSVSGGPYSAYAPPNQTDTSLPSNHIYDKVVTARFDLKKFWNVKLEGHFMDGYGASTFPDGFYPQVNPQGFAPNTHALVIKTGVNF
jgi:hypothetical protein